MLGATSFYGSSSSRRRDGGRKTSTPVRPRSERRSGARPEVYRPGMNLESLPEYANEDTSSEEGFDFNDEPTTSFESPYLMNRPHSQSTPSNVRPHPAMSMSNTPVMSDAVMAMLQKQQALIQQVLVGQKSIERRQDVFEERILSLESKYENSTAVCLQILVMERESE